MIVYVVANHDNGDMYFCEINSAWTSREKAEERKELLLVRDGEDDYQWDIYPTRLDRDDIGIS